MSVVYEARAIFQDGHYPNLVEHDHDHGADHHVSYASPDDVAIPDITGSYGSLAASLGEDRNLMHDGMPDIDINSLAASATMASLTSDLPDGLSSTPTLDEAESPAASSGRSRCIPKPERDVQKQVDGKYYCTNAECTEDVRAFSRKCEWK